MYNDFVEDRATLQASIDQLKVFAHRSVIDSVAKSVGKTFEGSGAVSAPKEAKKGRTFPVTLDIQPTQLPFNPDSLAKDFPQNALQGETPWIKFTREMTATLVGYGFDTPGQGSAPRGQ